MDAINAAYPTLETTLPCNYDEDHTDPMTSIIRTECYPFGHNLHLTDRRLPPPILVYWLPRWLCSTKLIVTAAYRKVPVAIDWSCSR